MQESVFSFYKYVISWKICSLHYSVHKHTRNDFYAFYWKLHDTESMVGQPILTAIIIRGISEWVKQTLKTCDVCMQVLIV